MVFSAGVSKRKNFKIAEESHAKYMFEWLPLSQLNVLKIDGMFKLQLLMFCFDLINNNLSAYFINICSLLQPVIYH